MTIKVATTAIAQPVFLVNTSNTAAQADASLFTNISTANTTLVKTGVGSLYRLVINTQVASATITLYDSLTATGTKIGTITLPSTITGIDPVTLMYGIQFNTGLTIVTSGLTDITAVYR